MILSIGLCARAFAEAPLEADAVRQQRRIREQQPLWRSVLALPNEAVGLVAWPIKHALFFAEAVNLPGRMRDTVLFPIHRLTKAKEGS
jgi:hypothetical protein